MATLYDVLQISQDASPEIVRATYDRLISSVRGQDSEAENRRKALNEAFLTLGNPEFRKRYDDRLANRNLVVEKDAERPAAAKYLMVALIVCGGILGYTKYNQTQENARLERDRIAAEKQKAELAAQEEQERRKAELSRLRAEQVAEQRQRYEFERARRESDASMRVNRATEDRARRDDERQRQNAEQQARLANRSEQLDAQRRVEREKAYLRQLEAENSRGRGSAYLTR